MGAGGRRVTVGERAGALIFAAGALSVLAVAAWLDPAPVGLGTHEQLPGMRPCIWLGVTGHPCPTCGMTTSFAHAAEGEYLGALHAQPFGAVLAVATSAAFWVFLHVGLFGSRLVDALAAAFGRWSLWGALAGLLVGWAYKILTFPG